MDDQHLEATLDPLFIFLILAAFSTLALLQTLTQSVTYPGLQLYVNIGALFTAFSLILLVVQARAGSPIIGPITRPVPVFGRFLTAAESRIVAPVVALVGGYGGIIAVNYYFTQFTFIPSVSFWTSLTPKLFYGSGGIIETIVFGFAPILLILIIARPLIVKWRYFLLVNVVLSVAAVIYHLYAYPNNPKALSIVFGEFFIFNLAYRFTGLLAWVPALLHAITDVAGSP